MKADGTYRVNVKEGDYLLSFRNKTNKPFGSEIYRAGTDGVFETGSGSDSTSLTFTDLMAGAGNSLNAAYIAGNTITTSGAEGDVNIGGTEIVNITATGGLNLDNAFDFDELRKWDEVSLFAIQKSIESRPAHAQ